MLIAPWVAGLVRRRPGRLAGTALGIAVAVALTGSIGAFLHASQATMTQRTAENVAVDWQVEAQAGADLAAVDSAVAAAPGVISTRPVDYGTVSGYSAVTEGTTQSTGSGVALGIPADYAATFPGEIRLLVGSLDGAVVAQQTAATLRVKAGDSVSVQRAGLPDASVQVIGVVELAAADSLFQHVGAGPGSQPSAPPDNVLLLPAATWHQLFDPLAASRPELVRHQVHARLDHALPDSPADAFAQVTAAAHNLESRLSGSVLVGDNLGAALSAARGDAAYATALFLFLGIPGAALAGLLTVVVGASGRERRRRDQALLRTRGAAPATLVKLAVAESLATALAGTLAGVGLALVIGRAAFGGWGFGAGWSGALWLGLAALVGLGVTVLAALGPAVRDARHLSVVSARLSTARAGRRAWPAALAATVLLSVALAGFLLTRGDAYALVLAPEGVASIAVDYRALLGPGALWLGGALAVGVLTSLLLRRGRRVVAALVRPAAGPLASTVAAWISRQRRLLITALVCAALATAFAVSTSVFDATYAQQAEIDARLSNGADVTVATTPGAPGGADLGARLAAVDGVSAVEPLVHRFAYVGADLQDIYGVRARTIVAAGRLQDAYVGGGGGNVSDVVARLGATRDGILVSAETVKDFRLQTGDSLTLRLPERGSGRLVSVTFHLVGVVKEFPTAPKDSFLVANAEYVAAATGDPTVASFLLQTAGASPDTVAGRVRDALGPTVRVSDLVSSRRVVGSSLTAVDLAGLTRVESGFAIAMIAGSILLVLGLGLAERRRLLALAAVLGAKPRQLATLIGAETVIVVVGGAAFGALLGGALAVVLIDALNGVFDPPPAAPALPWPYLGAVAATLAGSLVALLAGAVAVTRRPQVSLLREL